MDGLHQKSGTENVVDLHGRLDSVSCLSCGCKQCRSLYQDELERLNQAYLDAKRSIQVEPGLESRPDGDINLGDIDVSNVSHVN